MENQELVIKIKRKPNWFILLITGIWILGWLSMNGIFIYCIIDDNVKADAEILLFMLFFFFAGLLIVKIFLWHLMGQEKITLDNKELRIEKLGTIMTVIKKYEIDDIESISNVNRPTTPRWIRFWGLGGGKIGLVYLGQEKYFGQTLSISEANEIIEQLNKRINTMTR